MSIPTKSWKEARVSRHRLAFQCRSSTQQRVSAVCSKPMSPWPGSRLHRADIKRVERHVAERIWVASRPRRPGA